MPDSFLIEYQAYRPNLAFAPDRGPRNFLNSLFTAIRSEPDWRGLWSQIEPGLAREDASQRRPYPFPSIDFTRKTLLVAALGTQPTGGYSVSINSVVEYRSQITVYVVALKPVNCGDQLNGVTLLVTSPIALALIPKTSKPVKFSITEAQSACGWLKRGHDAAP